jgi:hypothetical protein
MQPAASAVHNHSWQMGNYGWQMCWRWLALDLWQWQKLATGVG